MERKNAKYMGSEQQKGWTIGVSDFQTAVNLAEWGTYGPKGDQPLKYVRLMDCSTEHLKQIFGQLPPNSDYSAIITFILEQRKVK